MTKQRLNKAQILHAQKYVLATRQCCLTISLGILYDQFDASEKQLKNAIRAYKEETAKYRTWSADEVKRAYADLKAIAPRWHGVSLHEDVSEVGFRTDVNHMIWNAEACSMFTMLRILRTYFRATYAQLDYFCEKYSEFNQIYKEGGQVNIRQLARELYDVTGFDIFKEGRHEFV